MSEPITKSQWHEGDLDEEAARELVDRIESGLVSVWADVQVAYHGRAWLALGYASWDELCRNEFDTTRLRLPREERQEVVASLRETGMSTRAIAAATGTSYDTVQRDLRTGTGDRNLSPVTESTVVGLDGKQYRQSAHSEAPSSEVFEAELVEDTPSVPSPRRRPITDAADDAGWEIKRAADKIARLLADDRAEANGPQLALALRGHLQGVGISVANALARLDELDEPAD